MVNCNQINVEESLYKNIYTLHTHMYNFRIFNNSLLKQNPFLFLNIKQNNKIV